MRRALLRLIIALLLASWPGASLAAAREAAPGATGADREQIVGPLRGVPGSVAFPSRSGDHRAPTATITVEFQDNFPPAAREAFGYAIGIWREHLVTPVPIAIFASWGAGSDQGFASARPTQNLANFAGAPQRDTLYPAALANHLSGRDLLPNGPEILVFVNSNLSNWYFGIGQTPSDRVNFVGVILHEIGHGLGFDGTARMLGSGAGGWGDQGMPTIYDSFVVNGDGVRLTDTTQFPNPSTSLGQQLTGGNLFWSGAGGAATNGGNRPKLYAPRTWQPGASYLHLDESAYPAGTASSLMTPLISQGETEYNPGPLARGILADMGWTIANVPVPADPSQICFSQTGKCVGPTFFEYWTLHGGLAQQGLPITDAFGEVNPADGKTYRVQYFERARFESHPQNQLPFQVLLGLLGREQLQAKYGGTLPSPPADSPLGDECATFTETGKRVCGLFLTYWQEHGGLAQQGFFLTDLFLETNPTDGKQYPTQYFERARFEYHIENQGTPYAVLLGLLGREQVLAKPSPAQIHMNLMPFSGPQGRFLLVTGSGFTPSTEYFLQLVAQDGSTLTKAIRSHLAGTVYEKTGPGSAIPPGDYTARMTTALSNGTVLASATFRMPGAGEPAPAPRLSVTPPEGTASKSTFLFAGIGFMPNSEYLLRARSEEHQQTISFEGRAPDGDGVLLLETSLLSYQLPGIYIFEVLAGDGVQVIASVTYRLIPGESRP